MKKFRLIVLDEEKDSAKNILYEENVTGKNFMEVKSNAENLLKNNLFDGNLKPKNKIKIRLVSIKNSEKLEVYEMVWYDTSFAKNNGYFKGWEFKDLEEKKENKWRNFINTGFYPILFSIVILIIVLLISLVKNYSIILTEDNEKKLISTLSFIIFIIGFLYSGASPLLRVNFNERVNTNKGVIAFNILLEIPIWIAAIATIYNLNNNGLFEVIKFEWAILVVIIYAFGKVFVSSLLDIEKLSIKKEKIF